jgi:hypothetical protein
MARIIGIDAGNPLHRCLNEIIKKCCRLIRLEKESNAAADSANDSIIDIINYALLYRALMMNKEAVYEKK